MCEEMDLIYSTSVWDPTSAKEIIRINPRLIKVPSAINTDERVLNILFNEYEGQIHISLGMTKRFEEEKIINLAEKANCLNRIVLYDCISISCWNENLYLNEIKRLKIFMKKKFMLLVSASQRYCCRCCAFTLGATFFERHFN